MKKFSIILLILCLTTSVFAQDMKPLLGRQINWAHPLSKGLVGYWLFNEGSGNKVFDLSGNGNTGTLYNDTHFVPGKFGSALDFDGSDYVDLGSNSILDIATNRITVSCWVKFDSLTVPSSDIYLINQFEYKYILRSSTSKANFYIHGLSTTNVSGATTLLVNTWYHLVGTYDGSTIRIYVNGVLDGSQASTGTITAGGPLYFGCWKPTEERFDGQLDIPMIYNFTLSASEINLLYREPFCMFEEDLSVAQMYNYAVGVPVPVFYYHYVNHAFLVLPIIPLGLYCYVRRRKCAA